MRRMQQARSSSCSCTVAIARTGIGSAIAFLMTRLVTGGRVDAHVEREGLDFT
ncbi:hypothetical protein RM533_11820 [Croceicoccus sp. F390]|uniref:Uncharacterized protein n=1 Tax=Croceicoccus esteveae TaxID=3075597 RepID=A0ABU2ZJT0_9SPHN|nr:hypothetical protein [Croceicoccus sp. F390]MDT0576860.1 hypothetical protein [Croceicoccus sp. F390]